MGFLRTSKVRPSWTVSELSRYLRELLEIDYRLQDVEVAGEISNFSEARSGHLYFTLKDVGSQLRCVMWRSAAEKLRFALRDGDAVVVNGRITLYEAGGVYQLSVERVVPAGRGDLALMFEQLKERLSAEGLFDADHKKAIPTFPQKIGIITSADAAALRDILNVLHRRCPLVQVLIAPTLVQGAEAPAQIVQAVQWLDGRSDIDTLIIARGGGSMEDLWAFNDERVVRAVYATEHPIISGVGHEVDFTLTDFVADLRAPTPSAAAELAVPDLAEFDGRRLDLQARLFITLKTYLAQQRWQVQALSKALAHQNPRHRLEGNHQRLDELTQRLHDGMMRFMERKGGRLELGEARLTAVSPIATLARGYAIVRDVNGRVLHTTQQAQPGQPITLQLSDGFLQATLDNPQES